LAPAIASAKPRWPAGLGWNVCGEISGSPLRPKVTPWIQSSAGPQMRWSSNAPRGSTKRKPKFRAIVAISPSSCPAALRRSERAPRVSDPTLAQNVER
jgi:hypothetical protein